MEESMVIGHHPVPSVQALAEDFNGLTQIPQRYVRYEAQSDPVTTVNGDLEIPMIDMSKLLDPKSSTQESIRLHLACKDWGFFQQITMTENHRVVGGPERTQFMQMGMPVKDGETPLCGLNHGHMLGDKFLKEQDSRFIVEPYVRIQFNTRKFSREPKHPVGVTSLVVKGSHDLTLINHNIPTEIIEGMKADIKDFFKLPLEKKEEFRQLPGNVEGYGQLFVTSDDQKLDWADVLYLGTQPLVRRKVDLWPTQPTTLRDTIEKYTSELYLLAHDLIGFVFENLGVSPEIITNMLKDGIQSVRMNYYPPCQQADKVLGFSPHSDASILTLVLQVNQVQGLQIKKNGGWVPVNRLPGAFIVNLGDMCEIYSNGTYRSIEHRAIVNKENERLSIATFHSASPSSVIGPLPEIVRDGEAKYKTVDSTDYMRLFFSSKLDGKSFIDRMKLNR